MRKLLQEIFYYLFPKSKKITGIIRNTIFEDAERLIFIPSNGDLPSSALNPGIHTMKVTEKVVNVGLRAGKTIKARLSPNVATKLDQLRTGMKVKVHAIIHGTESNEKNTEYEIIAFG